MSECESLFKSRGHHHAFESEEADATYVAKVLIRISYKKRGGFAPAEEDVMVVAERAVSGAASAYAFHTAQIESASLEGVWEERDAQCS